MKKRDSSPKAARIATASLSVLLAVAIGTTCGATSYRSLVCSTIGGTMYKTIDKANAEPLQASTDNGMSLDEWKKAADQLVEDVTSEGIVLLKNQNQTLPLAKGSKVTLFGRSSVDLVLGGTGAGNINTDYVVDLKSAMEADGRFTINSTIWDFYKTYDGKDGYVRSNGGYMGAKPEDIYTAEVPVSEYTDEVKQSYIDYNDAAIVVFSRVGGEASDMPTGAFGDGEKYLALQPAEEALLKEIKNSGAFDKIIAVINTSNAMELSWVDQEEYGIDACLWIGGVGQSGSRAVAKVLDGEVNPSGRLSDTYAADSFSSPAMQNFGDFTFTNADEINSSIGEANNGTKYVVYREGIYVGYRYYETRYSDGVTDPAGTNALSSAGAFVGDTWNYDNEVCYPFGYGLSYGAEDGLPFTQEVVSSKMSDDGLEMQVKVTNNGTAAGKNVVELYAQQPYTCGGIEKSAVQLVGFDKTDILEPGQSETVTITVPKKEFSSYDYRTDKTYVLDAGDYHFAIGNSAHDALNNILAAQGKTVEDGMDAEGDAEKVYLWNNAKKTLLNVSYSGDEVTNRFDDASLEYYGEDTDYLTRSDWSTFPESYTDLTATADMMAAIDAEGSYEPGSSDTSAIITGQDNQMTLAKMYGVPFDDTETWDKLLNQLTTGEMTRIVTGSALSPIPSIAYPAMFMKDGPQGNQLRTYVEDGTSATGFCGEVLRACSFNRDLMYEVGTAMGEDWYRTETVGAYTPAVNIHRTPYAGRNFEYYSEDGFLSGELATQEVEGLQNHGVICYIKHFALNDQETNRQGICTFSNEQAIREIYLKAFEKPFTEGKVKGSMGAFNRIGCTWAGAHSGLQKDVVRTEWGSTAILDTDIAINTTMQSVVGGLEGGNTMWATSGSVFYGYMVDKVPKDAKLLANMREACHVILYNVANSNGINGLSATAHVVSVTPYWEKLAYALIAVLSIADAVAAFFVVKNSKRKETL